MFHFTHISDLDFSFENFFNYESYSDLMKLNILITDETFCLEKMERVSQRT